MIEHPAGRWEGASAGELAARWGIPAVHLFERVGSTNDVARALAAEGAPSGTAVLAEEQVAGRGRGGRGWSSPPGLGIWLSVLLRPAALPAPGLLPLRVGLAAAEALDPFAAPAPVRVKWPNDLLLAGGKLAGVLCEGSWEGAHPSFVVVGIGVNVGHAPDDFPAEIRPHATSLRIASGWTPPRAEVAGALVRAVCGLPRELPRELDPREAGALAGRDALRGREVVVARAPGAPALRGTALGVTPDGALLVRTAEGEIHPLRSGTVRLAPPPAAGSALDAGGDSS